VSATANAISQTERLEQFGTVTKHGQALPLRWLRAVAWFCRHKPLGAIGGFIVVLLLLCAAFASQIAPYGYDVRDYTRLLANPSFAHLLGTDDVGRDIFSRIVYGARVSVIVGFGTVSLSTIVAGLIGIPAGYFGGKLDLIEQRFVDIWLSVPPLVLLITFAAIFGTPTTNITILPDPFKTTLNPAEIRTAQIIFALGLILAGGSSRVFRSAAISVRNNQYNEAARAIGASDLRILWHYILPNVLPVMLVIATVQLGTAILIEASLSFLGFGIPPPVPAWGSMLSGNATQFVNRAPILAVWPGLAISFAVFGFNMLGDGLRDVLDPRLRGSQ
jgi:peptide/nickel transport system permease protein